jgi:hypothetical protein
LPQIRNAIKGIIVTAGSFVRIAIPRNIPETSASRVTLYPFLWSLSCSLLQYTANNIDISKNGSRILSRTILLKSQVRGIRAKRMEAIKATFLL